MEAVYINIIKSTFEHFIDFNKNAEMINNYDWLSNINYINFHNVDDLE